MSGGGQRHAKVEKQKFCVKALMGLKRGNWFERIDVRWYEDELRQQREMPNQHKTYSPQNEFVIPAITAGFVELIYSEDLYLCVSIQLS